MTLCRSLLLILNITSYSAFAQSPLPTPIMMPDVAVVTLAPVAYQPLTVTATFSTAYCLNTDAPIYSQVSLTSGVLSVALSHLKAGPCVTSKTLSLPGLPAGTYGVRISVTADDSGGIQRRRTYEAEVGQTSVTVSLPKGLASGVPMCMTRSDAPAYGPFGSGPIVLAFRCSEEPAIPFGATRTTGLTPLLVGTNSADFTVFAATTATDRQSLPATFTPLYAINYPAPLAGTYWTTSLPDCTTLNQQWQGRNTCDGTDAYVLRARSGACPIGASPVYRLYQPKVIAHRYTQSAETYAALIDVGYTGEGVVWCAPVHN